MAGVEIGLGVLIGPHIRLISPFHPYCLFGAREARGVNNAAGRAQGSHRALVIRCYSGSRLGHPRDAGEIS